MTRRISHDVWRLALRAVYGPLVRRAFNRAVLGRELDPERPQTGRLLAHQVRGIERELWRRLAAMDVADAFAKLPTWGNRHNVYLAAVTLAGYQALRVHGIPRDHALRLLGDAGWQIYLSLVRIPRLIGRITRRDRQKRLEGIIRSLLIFPFSAPGRPGYEVKVWSEAGRLYTHFTCCPPYEFVKAHALRHHDDEALEAFRRSWCRYDWALAYALIDGTPGVSGSYSRPRTMSYGDDVCDMCWSAGGNPGDAPGRRQTETP